ncbi:MAG: CvpA family protein [Planctomycetota bacterium]|jgi:uncharacterized membrane protein required for colicin V production
MAIYDILVIFCLCFFGIVGWIKGLSWQLMGVLTIVLGFTVAYPLSSYLEPYAADWLGLGLTQSEAKQVSDADLRDISFLARGAAWTGSFALIWLFTHLLYYLFREGIERWHMEELNRSLGAAFGLVKGVLVVCAMTLIVVTLGVERTRTPDAKRVRVRVPPFLDGSAVAPTVTKVLRLGRFAMPASFADGFTEYLEAVPNLDEETRTATVADPHTPAAGGAKDGSKDGGKSKKKTKKSDKKQPDSPEKAKPDGEKAADGDEKEAAAPGEDTEDGGEKSSGDDDDE